MAFVENSNNPISLVTDARQLIGTLVKIIKNSKQ